MRRRIVGRRLLSVAGAAVALLVVVSMAAAALLPLGTIMFISDRDYPTTAGSDIYTMDSDGSGVSRLTSSPAVENDPVLSPDGTKLAYEVAGHVWVQDLAGGDPVDLLAGCEPYTSAKPCGYAAQPAWSPDGTKIAFTFLWQGASHFTTSIEVIKLDDGSRVHAFFNNYFTSSFETRAYEPTWSPDGTKIAFTYLYLYYSGAKTYNIDIVNANTNMGQATFLTTGRMPAWSPGDGNFIAFVNKHVESLPGYDPIDYGDDIAIVPACDYCDHNPQWFVPAYGRDWNPSWSGDGTSILFQTERWTTPAATDAEAVFHLWAEDAFPWDNDPNISDDYGLDLTALSAVSAVPPADYVPPSYSDTMAAWHWPVYDISGLFSPVRGLHHVKAGQAVPIKFSLGGDQGLDILMDGYPRTTAISCGIFEGESVAVETITAGATSLTYDPVEDQYIYIWKTAKTLKGCREFQLAFKDGTLLTADFYIR